MAWDLSCKDWEDRLKSGRSLVPDLPLDLVQGNRAVAIFNKLKLADVTGTPTNAEAGAEWFRQIVRALFGSFDPVTKTRMIRELMLLVPKKNNKTTGGALLMLTALLMNVRPNARMIMTAPIQDTAQMAFDAAAGAIALDPVLEKKLHVREHLKTIVHRETGSKLEIFSFDPAALTGQKISAALIDELHVIAQSAKAASAIRQLRGGMIPFPEAFLAFITTQSEAAPAGVFKAELTKARAIRDGTRTGVMLPVLYEFPVEMQKDQKVWQDPANWPMVTPNAGLSIQMDRLAEEFKTAKETSNEELRAWASQHLNIEIGIAMAGEHWAAAEFWEQQAIKSFTLEDLLDRCEVVCIGIDGGGLDDLLGFAAVGRCSTTRKWVLWAHAWAHPSVLARRPEIAPRLQDFADEGDLTIVQQMGDDVLSVADLCAQCEARGTLNLIGLDPQGIGAILDALLEAEVPEEKVVAIKQGWTMVGAIKTMERKLAERLMEHGAQDMMAWCIGNAKPEPRGNAILITKQVSGSAKIDPLMAALNAVSLMSLNPTADKPKHQMFFC